MVGSEGTHPQSQRRLWGIGGRVQGDHCSALGVREYSQAWYHVFVHVHMESMVGVDFFTKRVYTLKVVLRAYVLVFIHLKSRDVYCSPATFNASGRPT